MVSCKCWHPFFGFLQHFLELVEEKKLTLVLHHILMVSISRFITWFYLMYLERGYHNHEFLKFPAFFLTYVKFPWSIECTISQTSPDNDFHPSPLSQTFNPYIYAFSKSHTAYMKFHFSTTSFKYVNFSLTQNEITCLFLDLEELHFAQTFSWPVATISKN